MENCYQQERQITQLNPDGELTYLFSPGRSLGEPLGLNLPPLILCSLLLLSGIPFREHRVHTQLMLATRQLFECFCYFFVFLFTLFPFVFLLFSTHHPQVLLQCCNHRLRMKRLPPHGDSEDPGIFYLPAIVRDTFTLSSKRECSLDLFLVQIISYLPYSEWPLEGDLLPVMNPRCNSPPTILLLSQWG